MASRRFQQKWGNCHSAYIMLCVLGINPLNEHSYIYHFCRDTILTTIYYVYHNPKFVKAQLHWYPETTYIYLQNPVVARPRLTRLCVYKQRRLKKKSGINALSSCAVWASNKPLTVTARRRENQCCKKLVTNSSRKTQ